MTLPWKQLAKRLFEAQSCEGIARGGLQDVLARLEEVQHCCDRAVANRAEIERLEIESDRRAAQTHVREFLERISQVCPFDLDWLFCTLLEVLYAQRGGFRAYHNLRHIDEMATAYAEVRDHVGWEAPANVFAALLMHDAVIGRRFDNEERSAELARQLLPALVPLQAREQIYVADVAAYIRFTAGHGRISGGPDESGKLLSRDAVHFLDCDMSILGAPRERFLEYDADIAREYEGVISKDAYRAGRRVFLERLAHPEHRIFLSDFFHDRLEQRAKENLGVALELLRPV